MEPGFLLDVYRKVQQHWQRGLPEYHDKVFGIPVGAYELKVDRSNLVPVVTWRCSTCHLLRSYAE